MVHKAALQIVRGCIGQANDDVDSGHSKCLLSGTYFALSSAITNSLYGMPYQFASYV